VRPTKLFINGTKWFMIFTLLYVLLLFNKGMDPGLNMAMNAWKISLICIVLCIAVSAKDTIGPVSSLHVYSTVCLKIHQ